MPINVSSRSETMKLVCLDDFLEARESRKQLEIVSLLHNLIFSSFGFLRQINYVNIPGFGSVKYSES